MAATKDDAPKAKDDKGREVYVPTGKPRGRKPGQKSKKKIAAEKHRARMMKMHAEKGHNVNV